MPKKAGEEGGERKKVWEEGEEEKRKKKGQGWTPKTWLSDFHPPIIQ